LEARHGDATNSKALAHVIEHTRRLVGESVHEATVRSRPYPERSPSMTLIEDSIMGQTNQAKDVPSVMDRIQGRR
jgi:hypothetical protein